MKLLGGLGLQYVEFLKSHPKGHFMQSPEWAVVKKDWHNEVILVRDEDENIKGAMSVLIRKIPMMPFKIMYSPRGPVCDIHDRATLAELTQKARALAKKHRAYVLKIDPDVESSEQEFVNTMKDLKYKQKASKNFEGIQPNYVFRLDLEGKNEEQLMQGLHNKTRYNIRVAIKNGVEVSIGDRDDLPEFHKIMVETGLRDEFVVRSLDYFERMYDALGGQMRLYLAHYDGKMIAGTIAILYGDKVWYLYGASANKYRNVMPNYLLQWEMIKWALEEGCRIYDFRGVSGDLREDNPLYGLYRFKKGYGGKFTEFVGQMELVFNPMLAFCIDFGTRVFMWLRKKVFLRRRK